MNFSYMDSFLDYLTWERHYPGVDCLVTVRGETVYRYGRGLADIDTCTPTVPNQLYNIFSASKVITCTAGMQLLERGRIALTQPLYDIFPEYRHMQVKTIGGVRPAKADITIGDLFTMTAGFSYELNRPSFDHVYAKTNGQMPLREVVRAMAADPLEFEPGSRWLYSLCHDVLGAVIEEVSGVSFGQYLKDNIYDPLGMKDTGFARTDDVCSRIAPMYERVMGTDGAEHIQKTDKLRPAYVFGSCYESGGAGIVTSVEDYIKFMVALCAGGTARDGTRILSKPAVELMRTNRLTGQQMTDYGHPGHGYGLGVRVTMNPAEAQELTPQQEFGWGGAAGAHVLMDPVNQVCMYYSQHMLNCNGEYVHPRLCNLLYGALDL